MRISKRTIDQIKPKIHVQTPGPASFQLPEKVLQFGTGVLLRGLPDYFIDQANKQGLFNGRIVMVKSTSKGDSKAFDDQDGIYTLCVRGLENGTKTERYYLNNAVSRVLSAREQWDQVLACASSESMQIIISNTTEVGIQLTDDDVTAAPPSSFPGKLLAFLVARYKAFQGDAASGMVIIPTELVTDNGAKLKKILTELAVKNNLQEDFLHWLVNSNTFCNSLVDRIVPGKLPPAELKELEEQLGYQDELLISAEPYCLWAIESPDEQTNKVLSFSTAAPGVILTRDITKHRELKLRLLNGTHTFSCALAYLSGSDTVGESMKDKKIRGFIENLMTKEIAPAITGAMIPLEEATAFASRVLDRFRNPFIIHPWLSISVQYTSKMRMRNVPLLLAHDQQSGKTPEGMVIGLAAYLFFMRSKGNPDGTFSGVRGETSYLIQDDHAERLCHWWEKYPDDPTQAILSDTGLWGTDLTRLEGLSEATSAKVKEWIKKTNNNGG